MNAYYAMLIMNVVKMNTNKLMVKEKIALVGGAESLGEQIEK